MDLFMTILLVIGSLLICFVLFCFGFVQYELCEEKVPFINAYKKMLSLKNKTSFNKFIYVILVGLLGVVYGVFLLLYYSSAIVFLIFSLCVLLIGEIFSLFFLKSRFFVHNILIRQYRLHIFYKKADLTEVRKKTYGFKIISAEEYKEKRKDVLNFEIQAKDESFKKICEFRYSDENKCWELGPISENIEERWAKLCQKIL